MATKLDPTLTIPQFDVISVKPGKDTRTQMQFTPDGLRGTGVTVRFLIYEGYGGINHQQVIGEPAWSSTEGFDIEAKVALADVPTLSKMTFEQRRTMFQSILADRFKLVAHHETRELPLYVLSVAKHGPKLKPSAPDDAAASTPRRTFMMVNNGKVTANDAQLSMLVTVLSRTLGRTIRQDRPHGQVRLYAGVRAGGRRRTAAGRRRGSRWRIALISVRLGSVSIHRTPRAARPQTRVHQGPGGRHCHRPHRKGRRELALVTPRKTAISVT